MPVLTPSWKLTLRTYLFTSEKGKFRSSFCRDYRLLFLLPYLPFLKHLRKNFEFKSPNGFLSQLAPCGASKTLGAKNCYATFSILFCNLFSCYKILPYFVDWYLLHLSFCRPIFFLEKISPCLRQRCCLKLDAYHYGFKEIRFG